MPGAGQGATLNTALRRTVAALAVLSTLAASASTPIKTGAQDSITPPVVAASVFPDLSVDDRAEQAADRAARANRPAVQAIGPAAQPTKVVTRKPVKTSKTQPRPPRRTEDAPAAPMVAAGRYTPVLAFLHAQLGKPYVWGTTGPRSYDCSGLLVAAWKRIGVTLPHQSGAIGRLGRAIPRGQWIPGTVLVYSGHVAVFVGSGRMIHAANPRKGVLLAAVYGAPQGRLIG